MVDIAVLENKLKQLNNDCKDEKVARQVSEWNKAYYGSKVLAGIIEDIKKGRDY